MRKEIGQIEGQFRGRFGENPRVVGGDLQAAKQQFSVSELEKAALTQALAIDLVDRGGFSNTMLSDAVHLAVAMSHEIDYLLTWNCRHLANLAVLGWLERWGCDCRLSELHSGWLEVLQMDTNEILEESRAIKEQLAKEAGLDIRKYLEQLEKFAENFEYTSPRLRTREEVRNFLDFGILPEAPAVREDAEGYGAQKE